MDECNQNIKSKSNSSCLVLLCALGEVNELTARNVWRIRDRMRFDAIVDEKDR
jgi:hypothetical protein